ncbi:MAG: GLPGLI family protein [Runella sp.]
MKATLFIFLGLFCVGAHAQQTLALQYQLQANGLRLKYDLYFDGTASAFILQDEEVKKAEKNQPNSQNSDMVSVSVNDGQDFVLYKNYQTLQMASRELVFNGSKCVVIDSIPTFDWKLLSEHKKVGNFNCQKATTTWRCANYEVWFAPEIPYNLGPWKLNGLPGLIVEAHNLTADHRYSLTSLSTTATPQMLKAIKPPAGKDPVHDFREYAQIQKKELKKMETFLKAKAGNPESGQFKANLPECF